MPEQIIITQKENSPISVSQLQDTTIVITQGLKSPVFVDKANAKDLLKAIKAMLEY